MSDLELARALQRHWVSQAVCVTMGQEGAFLVADGFARSVPAEPTSGDPCGAGDRFASSLVEALALGGTLEDAVRAAVTSASRFVRNQELHLGVEFERVRADLAGVRTVATSGCFDLLHPGHVAMLRAARELGDTLVVLLNSDASVRRLKGPTRPVMQQSERAALLEALGCVDDVVVFDDETPERVLRELRPNVFAKGGDYRADEIPEARVMEELGGEVVILPFFGQNSSTDMIARCVRSSVG